tara:strand:+ start:461 stop:676 length:216 start_codon:yes stop_codon:yes gene_type:complete
MDNKLLYLVLSFAGSFGARKVFNSMRDVRKLERSYFDNVKPDMNCNNPCYDRGFSRRKEIRRDIFYSGELK